MDAYFVRINPINTESMTTSMIAVENAIEQAENQSGYVLDLEESWAAIHFTITSEYPIPKYEALQQKMSWDDTSLENVIMGRSKTLFEASFGAARYLNPQEVALMAEELNLFTVDKFKEFYDSKFMREEHILPDYYWDDDNMTLDWLVSCFIKLVNFYSIAANVGEGILIYMI